MAKKQSKDKTVKADAPRSVVTFEDVKAKWLALAIERGLSAEERLEGIRRDWAAAQGVEYVPRRSSIPGVLIAAQPGSDADEESKLQDRLDPTGRKVGRTISG